MKTTPLTGKKCYNHLGGKLGAALFEFMVQEGWIVAKAETPNTYELTEKGYEALQSLGLDLSEQA